VDAIEYIYPDTNGTITKIIPLLVKDKEQMTLEEIRLLKEKLAVKKSRTGFEYEDLPKYKALTEAQKNEFRHYHTKLVRRMEEMEELKAEIKRIENWIMIRTALLEPHKARKMDDHES